MNQEYYLRIGKASDLENWKERLIYRFFEILPGLLSWLTIIAAILFSWLKPFWVAIFIICFSIFWFFRTIYYTFYLWIGYKKMEENEKIDWLEKLNQLDLASSGSKLKIEGWQEIYHLIVIPMYSEPLEIVKESFNNLVNADYPKEKMLVVLACEEKTREKAKLVAMAIEKEFKDKFFKFLITWHPKNITGEIGGKGSNEAWAAKKAKKEIIDPLKIPYENIIFSSFDVDTCIFKKYFSCLTYYYLTSENPTQTSFQPVPLFINNIWQAPALSQVFSFSATFWHTMNQERPDKLITFSSHSMSFKALVDVDFKQTNVVSDDSRIFWQCFFRYNGDYNVVPLYYPLSMDANVSRSFFRTIVNIYKQQRRWAYGVCDVPYFFFGFLKNKKIPFKKKYRLGMEVFSGHLTWATASILIFLLGWLPIVLGGKHFSQTLISYNLPRVVNKIMIFSMVGLLVSIYVSFLILPPKPPQYGKYKYIIFIFSWLFFPLMMIFFTALPALDAQTCLMLGKYMGFWVTEKMRKN
jgi:cellulose synthase/poly-beta-1,6-N-acetylglucosamine synthase-like glycosyltransferase